MGQDGSGSVAAPLMLSISGLRGIVGASLTPEVAVRYAGAIGSWFAARTAGRPPKLVIGRDSRVSGEMIEAAVAAGLAATGCHVTVLGVATTPGVAIMIDQREADGGVVITASHNPAPWNGVKILTHDGVAPPAHEASEVVQRFERQDIAWVAAEALPPFERDDRLPVLHADRITPLVDVRAIARRRPRVVLDSVHGAGGPETARLLAQLDVSCVHLFAEPTGRFPHPPEPTLDHLQGLCEAVRDHGADVGFAQDPDGDRLAIVDENGRYIGEEYTLVLSALRVLERAAERGMTSPTLCANLSTSRMIDDLASRFGGRVVRTPVGEAHVAAAMTRENALIGGEGNGGVMLPQVTLVRNSLVGVALTLDLLASRPGMTLSEIVDSLPAYGIVKDKVDLAGRTFDNLADALAPGFDGFSVDAQDGVRLDGAEGWLHVRPSNTEPILRLIAEAPDPADARRLIERAREQLGLA